MDAIIVLIGLVIGVVLFLAFMSSVTAIVYNIRSVAFTFFICWGIGIVLAWIGWKIALIVGVIAFVLFIIAKIFGTGSDSEENAENIDGEATTEERATVENNTTAVANTETQSE